MCFVLYLVVIQWSNLFLKKELSLFGAAPNRQTLKAVIFASGRLLHPPSSVYLSAFGLPELGPFRIGKNRKPPDWQK